MPITRTQARLGGLTALLGVTILSLGGAAACSRLLWNDNGLAVLVGRTMDWPESTEPTLMVMPQGMDRDGARLGSTAVVTQNGLRWTSLYGSLVTTIYGLGTADGLNERGLAAHMLFLKGTDFGPRDPGRPGLQAGLWAQYVLDNAATVTKALALLETVQPVMAETHGTKTTVHLAIEDASGDSAIVEYVGGKPLIHHGREYRIMTNDPPYDEQLTLLQARDFSRPSSDTPVPGNVNPRDRFQRAAYFSAMLPAPKTDREAAAAMFAIVRNLSVPFGAPYKGFGIYNTEYRTVADLSNKRYFFELTTSPNVIWADLTAFALTPGSPVIALDPDSIDLSGNVSARFLARATAPF